MFGIHIDKDKNKTALSQRFLMSHNAGYDGGNIEIEEQYQKLNEVLTSDSAYGHRFIAVEVPYVEAIAYMDSYSDTECTCRFKNVYTEEEQEIKLIRYEDASVHSGYKRLFDVLVPIEEQQKELALGVTHNGGVVEVSAMFFTRNEIDMDTFNPIEVSLNMYAAYFSRTNRRKFWVEPEDMFFHSPHGSYIDNMTKSSPTPATIAASECGLDYFMLSSESGDRAIKNTAKGRFFFEMSDGTASIDFITVDLYDMVQKHAPLNWYDKKLSVDESELTITLNLLLSICKKMSDDSSTHSAKDGKPLKEEKDVVRRYSFSFAKNEKGDEVIIISVIEKDKIQVYPISDEYKYQHITIETEQPFIQEADYIFGFKELCYNDRFCELIKESFDLSLPSCKNVTKVADEVQKLQNEEFAKFSKYL